MEKLKKAANNYIKIVLGAYLVLMIVIFPFYAPQGYVEIGVSKYNFFKMSGILSLIAALPAVVILVISGMETCIRNKKTGRLSVTDKAMLLYGAAVLFSFICTKWKKDAVWGAEGWYMGLFSQLMFAVVYFAVSRFAENIKIWYRVLLAVSFAVFGLGILNRFSVYPVEMEGSVPGFISTLGNINWFCSYWMVVFPIGLVLYWIGEETTGWGKAALIIYILLGFMTGLTQGSSSGFLALAAVLITMLLLSFSENEKLLRWLELVLMFSVGILLLSVIQNIFPEALNYENAIEKWLTKYMVAFCIFVSAVIFYTVLRYWLREKGGSVKALRLVQKGIIAVLLLLALTVILLVVYYNFWGKEAGNPKMAAAFTIDEDWGNARGTTWRTGVDAFASMPMLHKLVGIGPDCFYLYAYSNGDIALRLYNVFGEARLTNAHNEWLTILVNMGLLGLLSYAAVFGSAIYRQISGGRKNALLLVSSVCIISYTVHNMVSFQQVICTPVVFFLIGCGENLIRNDTKRS
ncbi:MAG: O-antigen ligase family protein [Lachnospiraceae bacterium]|nr:O-antigen ligase family protein [Lachnospiraceae bacterium]